MDEFIAAIDEVLEGASVGSVCSPDCRRKKRNRLHARMSRERRAEELEKLKKEVEKLRAENAELRANMKG